MSKRPIHSYVFNPGAATLDLSGIPGFDIRNLFAVIHLPTGSVIYAPKPGLGFSTVLNGVLRLQATVGAMSASDPLLVIYDDGGKPAEDTSVQAIVAALAAPAQTADVAAATAKIEAVRALLAAALTINLPAGAATAANQVATTNELAQIYNALVPLATDLDVQATTAKVEAVRALLAGTLAVSATALPLPSNAAKETGGALATLAANSPALGQATSAASVPVVLSSDGPFTTNFGAKADGAATSDSGSFSLIALTKRSLGYLATLAGAVASGALKTAPQANAPNIAAASTITAAGAAAGFAIPTGQMAALGVMLSGTWSGAVSFYGSMDGGLTYPGQLTARPSGGAPTQSATGNGVFFLNPGAYDHVLVVATALASGSVAVTAVQTTAQKDARVYNTALDPLYSVSGGSAGTDFSANLGGNGVTIPNVGAVFAASGPYSGYTLVKTLPALASRAYAEVDNLSTGQVVVIRDDGTAASGAAPSNASLIVLNSAPAIGQPGGGGWSTTTFKGRIQIYAPAGTTPLVTAFQD